MRTGAIFARGSCRALKWMALVGMVFTLGSGQALAQEPEALSAPFAHYGVGTDGSAEPMRVRVVMDAEMDGNTPEPSAFKLRRNGADVMAGTATSLTADATIFDITFAAPVTAGLELYYEPGTGFVLQYSTGADVLEKVLVMEVLSSAPFIPIVDHKMVYRDQTSVEPIDLPPAVGGMPAVDTMPAGVAADGITYTLTATLNGTEITDLTTDPVLAFDSDKTVITVTPGSLTADRTYSMVYAAMAGDDPPSTFERNFEIEVTTRVRGTLDESGQITKIEVGGAVEKTIGGVDRMHVEEGEIDEVTVTVEWTSAQLRQIWDELPAGTSTPAPVTVVLDMIPVMVPSLAWVSEAETEVGHDDVTIGSGLTVDIPARPTDADRGLYTNSGSTSIAFNDDPDAENEAFKITVTNIDAFEDRSLAESADVHVIEDDETQYIELERVNKGDVYEGGPNEVFEVVADPAREDLVLNVRFDLEDVTGETVKSRDNTIDKAVGAVPVGSDGKETVTLTLDGNDANRTDDKIKLHVEVVDYARDTGAFTAVDEKEIEFTVIDIHKLPKLTVSPVEDTVMEGDSVMVTVTLDRNPANTIRQAGEGREYTLEEVTVMLTPGDMSSAEMEDYDLTPTMLTFDEWDGKVSTALESMMVEVMAHMDDDIEMGDDDVLMIDAEVDGTMSEYGPNTMYDMYPSASTLTLEDATDRLVWANDPDDNYPLIMAAIKEASGDNMMFTVGDPAIEIMGQALFSHADNMEGMTIEYAATSNMEEVARASEADNMLMVMAMSTMGGEAEITITATAVLPLGLKNLPQTEPNVAQLKFPVTVSPLVPALPLIAQLLMAALLGLGGYRRYLRR